MEIWLDTCDTQVIESACHFGFIYGITTNPSILAGITDDPEKVLQSLLDVQDGPVAVQITAERSDEIIKRAQALRVFSDRIIVKVPVTRPGLIAMKALSGSAIPVMATAIFQPNQALLAALAGVEYIAPYLGRMADAGINVYDTLKSMLLIYQQYGFSTKIIAAALKTPEQIQICAELGIDAVTLKSSLFSQFIEEDKNTLDSLRQFAGAWESRQHPPSTLTI